MFLITQHPPVDALLLEHAFVHCRGVSIEPDNTGTESGEVSLPLHQARQLIDAYTAPMAFHHDDH